ncbi:MAG: hypothetical protein M0P91_06610 [Sulfuricurvum sp.]|uniref:hypothetical protein n=1 Tax=Sulfuricurvum sp. TaxID=2025608 RepID=UPI0025E3D93C|nr:hypothetical protein [Sulfuricurvum sp.]MCK9372851.1 hypothetical protein [Sulfuricurvum sp.]
MKTKILLTLLPIFLSGCFNDRGVSLRYYNNCEEYYDIQGYYHKKCDKNLVDYKEIKESIQPPQNANYGQVW